MSEWLYTLNPVIQALVGGLFTWAVTATGAAVVVFTRQMSRALLDAIASSDVFLFPSDTETFGNVTLEAMASGLPTVCADATGSSSIVEDGGAGFLAPPGESGGFIEAVERLATDHRLRREMGRKALECAQTYEWSAVLDRIVGYYEEILHPEPVIAGQVGGNGHAAPDPGFSELVKENPPRPMSSERKRS